ncbi:hypothetical protein GCM10010174_82400 [Kutzneria viridogrisea]|uniref:HTH marR-type domain-containing protein n=2 Tax=Kutzneria TaxID=43356 RepID=W5WHS8_9PSEU|nr:MarR family transcriptional regulator [Kutzneria albida]AHI00127.1 hypothetical protein KALB_6768 [Kutzneria albida DSM 43870]MBA8925306.1 DNA-binding MarR family transcriptional regulator [Kutzneria viridogrisea]
MPPAEDEVVIPALLRAARGSYGHAIRARLADAGFEDVPHNGAYVLGGMVDHGGSAGQLVRELGISKQAASQLVDALVQRGYLTREDHPEDRRRVHIAVTERGRAAAAEVRAGVLGVDAELARMISPGELAGLRAGLTALTAIRQRLAEQSRGQAGRGRPAGG